MGISKIWTFMDNVTWHDHIRFYKYLLVLLTSIVHVVRAFWYKYETVHIYSGPCEMLFDIVPLQIRPLVTFLAIFALKFAIIISISLRHNFTLLKHGLKKGVAVCYSLVFNMWFHFNLLQNSIKFKLICL